MKTTSKPTSELLGKLTRYTALAGAAGLGGNLAQAGITVWNSEASITAPDDVPVPEHLYFDFETGTVQTTSFTGADFFLFASVDSSENFNNVWRVLSAPSENQILSSNSQPARLASGDLISSGTNFRSRGQLVNGVFSASFFNWGEMGRGYLGFKFDIGGETHYGWADITLENRTYAEGLPKITLHRFAYNTTPDEGILAGEVPEPESALPMALLVLGAAGLGRYRRQRAAHAGPDGEKTAA